MVSYNLRFREILEVLEKMEVLQGNLQNTVITSDLALLAEKHDFTYEINYLDRNTAVYLLFFEQDSFEDYVFAYAARYDWGDLQYEDPYLDEVAVDYNFEDEESTV